MTPAMAPPTAAPTLVCEELDPESDELETEVGSVTELDEENIVDDNAPELQEE